MTTNVFDSENSNKSNFYIYIVYYCCLAGGMIGVAYLCNSFISLCQYLVFILAIILPAIGLISICIAPCKFDRELELPLTLGIVLLLLVPLFFLRKILFPFYVWDILLSITLVTLAIRKKVYFFYWPKKPHTLHLSAAILLLCWWIPFFLPIFSGFAVHQSGMIYYYGTYPIDAGNLSSFVSILNTSQGLPTLEVEGSGIFHYHWFYFTVPAYLSNFLGGNIKNSTSLFLCNMITSTLFVMTLLTFVKKYLKYIVKDKKKLLLLPVLTTAIVIFASTVLYFYIAITQKLQLSWFTITGRNATFSSLLAIMENFGNNAIALSYIMLIILLISEWNKNLKIFTIIIVSIFTAAIVVYSITLLFSFGIALALWWLLGYIRKRSQVFCTSTTIGLMMLYVFYKMEIFAQSNYKITVAFDNGQYLQNLFFSLTPLLFLVLFSLPYRKFFSQLWILAGTAFIVPTFLYVKGSPTGNVDFSLKTTSLLMIAMAPMVAGGIYCLLRNYSLRIWRYIAIFLVALGIANTFIYSFRSIILRENQMKSTSQYQDTNNPIKLMAIPEDYFAILMYIQKSTSAHSIILDPFAMDYDVVSVTVFIAERKVFLPSGYFCKMNDLNDEWNQRLNHWQQWQQNYLNLELSHYFAQNVDYAILLSSIDLAPAHWEKRQIIGKYTLYCSILRQRDP